jgi:peptidoglycan-associated lipoprotein
VAGSCEKIPGWCKTDGDCIGKEKCRDMKCGDECLSDAECGDNEVCTNGSCQLKAECVVDSDCPSGKQCANGTCIDASGGGGACDPMAPVYFDFDQSALRSDARDTLRNHAECIKDGNRSVSIQGHCDDRGTEEYNLALGERRARSTKDYLKKLGAPRNRMSSISYGETRPAKHGGGADAWSSNRRCEFVWK